MSLKTLPINPTFYKYDYGQSFIIKGLPDISGSAWQSQIEYNDQLLTQNIDIKNGETTISIPDVVLQQNVNTFKVYIFETSGNIGTTDFLINCNLIDKKQPNNMVDPGLIPMPAGQAATVEIGKTTTLPAGTAATVTNTGTSSAAVFDFGIPQGEKGDPGKDGVNGENGKDGTPATIEVGGTATLAAGELASVINRGTDQNAILFFNIPQGLKGDQGEPGKDGKDGTGVTILGSYDSYETLKADHPTGSPGDSYLVNGDLYVWSDTSADWVNVGTIQGPQGEQGEPGPRGLTGEPGKDGADGTPATVTVGGTATISAGENATVTNTGTEQNAVLYFGIPKGEKGDKGDPGEPGENGTNGEDGAAATIEIGSVTTLPAGSDATVENVGTENAAVLNFGIPKGDTGETGTPGTSSPITSWRTVQLAQAYNTLDPLQNQTLTFTFDLETNERLAGVVGIQTASAYITVGQFYFKDNVVNVTILNNTETQVSGRDLTLTVLVFGE